VSGKTADQCGVSQRCITTGADIVLHSEVEAEIVQFVTPWRLIAWSSFSHHGKNVLEISLSGFNITMRKTIKIKEFKSREQVYSFYE